MQTSYASSVKNWAARLGVYFPKERPQDIELLTAVARGERRAMESLYLRYGPALRCVAEIMLGSEPEAEDLLHDVFCEAWERANSYQPARGSVGSWLLVRLRSRAIDRMKSPRCRRLVALENDHMESEQSLSPDCPATTYLALVTRRHLAKLPGQQKRMLLLLFYDDLSTAEVAAALKIPVGTVKSRLARTLDSLRDDRLTRRDDSDRSARAAADSVTARSAAAPRRFARLVRRPAAGLGVATFREPAAADPLEP